jgi:hypothetical protein
MFYMGHQLPVGQDLHILNFFCGSKTTLNIPTHSELNIIHLYTFSSKYTLMLHGLTLFTQLFQTKL